MAVKSLGKSKVLACVMLAAFGVFVAPAGPAVAGPGPAAGNGSLSGFIYAKDAKTPVAGATVRIRNVADQKEMASPPTDANGMYTIAGIPEGRYVLGVNSAQDNFNFDYALYVKGGELGKLSVALVAGGGGQGAGEASVKKKGFFNSVAGRVLVIAAVGVGLYFLIEGGEASPIK